MLLKCRDRLCEFIEIRETECIEMRPICVKMSRQAQPLTKNSNELIVPSPRAAFSISATRSFAGFPLDACAIPRTAKRSFYAPTPTFFFQSISKQMQLLGTLLVVSLYVSVVIFLIRIFVEIFPFPAQDQEKLRATLNIKYIITGIVLSVLGLFILIITTVSNERASNERASNNRSNHAKENQYNPNDHFLSEVRMLRGDARQILGVSRTATQTEIKKAYRKRALATHPNKGGTEANFKRVEAAYDVLKNA